MVALMLGHALITAGRKPPEADLRAPETATYSRTQEELHLKHRTIGDHLVEAKDLVAEILTVAEAWVTTCPPTSATRLTPPTDFL
jgi:hypothetical protein